jgi:mono/diheme cytochrome c family protein
MTHMNTRVVTLKVFLACTLIAFLALGSAFGQQKQSMQFEVPYEFAFGSQTLPAGTYTFSLEGENLAMRSQTGGPYRLPIVSRINGPAELLDEGSLVLDKAEAKRIVSEVWIPGVGGILVHSSPAGHTRDVLLASYLSQNRPVSGKVAYNLTCGRCHGPDGGGDAKADKFFKTAIPRLSSAAVQGKSDAQLKEVIAKGTSTMPPVEIDESGFRHRLPAQDVDAVIAYVRTLKR